MELYVGQPLRHQLDTPQTTVKSKHRVLKAAAEVTRHV